jgi:Uma2 family endonuclease
VGYHRRDERREVVMEMDGETKTLITAEEFLGLADGTKLQELVRGEVIELGPAGKESSRVAMRLAMRLARHVEAQRLGEVLGSEAGYVLSRDPDTVRAPDVSFLSRASLQREHNPYAFFPGPPDLAVEVVSPSDRLTELELKVQEYLAAGTRMVWVVLPKTKTVYAHRSPNEVERLRVGDVLTGDPVIPGFAVPVEEIFA